MGDPIGRCRVTLLSNFSSSGKVRRREQGVTVKYQTRLGSTQGDKTHSQWNPQCVALPNYNTFIPVGAEECSRHIGRCKK